ncbi:hypothetical protein F2P81_008345 [Scophthalmus maximus]|uniref:Uncharacterized protein n=1 Tax=Scophthalmus maximus TaxID=52904 RepID=A0A6A4T801_SCOMX|nr:hypothetical protein F2P81_008345 [Scophthalmus maximus]
MTSPAQDGGAQDVFSGNFCGGSGDASFFAVSCFRRIRQKNREIKHQMTQSHKSAVSFCSRSENQTEQCGESKRKIRFQFNSFSYNFYLIVPDDNIVRSVCSSPCDRVSANDLLRFLQCKRQRQIRPQWTVVSQLLLSLKSNRNRRK